MTIQQLGLYTVILVGAADPCVKCFYSNNVPIIEPRCFWTAAVFQLVPQGTRCRSRLCKSSFYSNPTQKLCIKDERSTSGYGGHFLGKEPSIFWLLYCLRLSKLNLEKLNSYLLLSFFYPIWSYWACFATGSKVRHPFLTALQHTDRDLEESRKK